MQYYGKSLIPNYNTKLDAHHNSIDVLRRLYQATSLTKYIDTFKVVCLFTRYPEPTSLNIITYWNKKYLERFVALSFPQVHIRTN